MSDTDETTTADSKRLEVDLSVYSPLFDDPSISEADKSALLQALWSIVLTFAQMGWGVHPVQQAQSSRCASDFTCGEIPAEIQNENHHHRNMVECDDQLLVSLFSDALDRRSQQAGKS